MNGKAMRQFFTKLIGGLAGNDVRFMYDLINAAARDYVARTMCLTGTATITTVEGQSRYALPTDFMEAKTKTPYDRRIVGKYTDTDGKITWPILTSYEKIFFTDETDNIAVPSVFCITDRDLPGEVTGAVTSGASESQGEITITDADASFDGNIFSGDHIQFSNMSGIVLRGSSDTALVAALFYDQELYDSTATISVSEDDAYRIFPQSRFDVMFKSGLKTAGESLEIPYYRYPAPVYSENGTFRLDGNAIVGILHEAAYLYNLDFDYDAKRDEHLHRKFIEEVNRKNVQLARHQLQGQRYTTRP